LERPEIQGEAVRLLSLSREKPREDEGDTLVTSSHIQLREGAGFTQNSEEDSAPSRWVKQKTEWMDSEGDLKI